MLKNLIMIHSPLDYNSSYISTILYNQSQFNCDFEFWTQPFFYWWQDYKWILVCLSICQSCFCIGWLKRTRHHPPILQHIKSSMVGWRVLQFGFNSLKEARASSSRYKIKIDNHAIASWCWKRQGHNYVIQQHVRSRWLVLQLHLIDIERDMYIILWFFKM